MSPMRRIARRLLPPWPWSVVLLLAPAPSASSQPAPQVGPSPFNEPRLVAFLVEEGLPELVEHCLPPESAPHKVLVARALARAAESGLDPKRREADIDQAESRYRQALEVGVQPEWSNSPRRRFAIARWHVELGDLILRLQCGPDLDDLEVHHRLRKPPSRLSDRLARAISAYRQADPALREFEAGIARDDDLLIAEGFADEIVPLARQCSLNLGWALTYRSRLLAVDDPQRAAALSEALRRFETAARSTERVEDRLVALIGAGVAFRELGKLDDAVKVLGGATRTADPIGLKCRGQYELALTHLRRGEPSLAADLLDGLASQADRPEIAPDRDAAFYVRLAPVLAAYARVLDGRTKPGLAGAELRRRGIDELNAIRQRGGVWPAVVDTYISDAIPTDASPSVLAAGEQIALARKLAAAGEVTKAAAAFRAYLDRPDPQTPAEKDLVRVELAECLEKAGQFKPAAELFTDVAERTADRELARRAARGAVSSLRRAAAASGLIGDDLELARVSLRLVDRLPDMPLAGEWIRPAAAALERARRFEEAQAAYARVPPTSADHAACQFALIRCKQSSLLDRGDTLKDAEFAAQAIAIAEEWRALSKRLLPTTQPVPGAPSDTAGLASQAVLQSAELLAHPRVGRCAEAVTLVAPMEQAPLASEHLARVITLRMRCRRALGQTGDTDAVTGELLARAADLQAGPALLAVAAELETEVGQLVNTGRLDDAKRLANQTVPILKRILDRLDSEARREADAAIVRFSMARMLVHGGRATEALPLLDALLRDNPSDAGYRRYHALACEQVARAAGYPSDAAARAEAAWARLLEDATLREAAPARYWEARYYWLRWQLDRGQAAEVARGIEAEQAWYPELGGPPWKERLLELAQRARVLARN